MKHMNTVLMLCWYWQWTTFSRDLQVLAHLISSFEHISCNGNSEKSIGTIHSTCKKSKWISRYCTVVKYLVWVNYGSPDRQSKTYYQLWSSDSSKVGNKICRTADINNHILNTMHNFMKDRYKPLVKGCPRGSSQKSSRHTSLRVSNILCTISNKHVSLGKSLSTRFTR